MKHFLMCLLYIAALGVLSFVVGRLIPKHWFHADRFPWVCHPAEQKLWKRLHVRKWQAKIPDMSRIFVKIMPEKKLTKENYENLPRMIEETCVAEWTHILLSIAGLGLLKIWSGVGGVCITIIYIVLGNLPFIVVQRYNRPRLQKLFAMQQRNLNYVANFLKSCIGLLAPILSGLLLAFVLSVPVRGLAKRLRRKLTKATDRQIDMISLLLTLICVIAIIALLCVIAIPQLTASVKSIAALVQEKWPDWVGLLQRYGIDTEKLSAHFAALDWKSILQSISSEMNTVISSVANVAGSTVSAIADVAISLVITFYVLIGWRELSSQSKRALYAYCKESVADRICHISKLAHDTYAKFLSGQCVEVMILGTLIFLSFSVAGIPYAGLTAVLTAAFAFVPYIGGFLSCAFGILFTLLAAPNKALLCLIVYQATQFVENQFIYPHVVGNSVGLSPFWTLLAVLLGGKLFGVLGMIFFIPLMALVSQLLHESIERRLHTRKPELSNVQSNSDENTDISQ